MLPDIGDIKKLRLRYPIAPVHGEGSGVWKEVNALRDMVNEKFSQTETPKTVAFEMSMTERNPPGEHTHEFILSYEDYLSVKNDGATVEVRTTQSNNHDHDLVISYNENNKKFEYTTCDDKTQLCWDGHPRTVMA